MAEVSAFVDYDLVLMIDDATGFTRGNTNTPFYQGHYLADAEDIVVVTIKSVN